MLSCWGSYSGKCFYHYHLVMGLCLGFTAVTGTVGNAVLLGVLPLPSSHGAVSGLHSCHWDGGECCLAGGPTQVSVSTTTI